MPVYEYIAINESGREIKGRLDAENERVARQKLRKSKLFPTTVQQATSASENTSRDVRKYLRSDKVSIKELSIATRQFATLVTAGLPLVSALQALAEQTDSDTMQRVLVQVRETVQEGKALANALGSHPKVFPRLYINLVAAGEASGTLDVVLERLADYLEAQVELRGKIFSALTYPVVMLVVCCLVIIGLLVGVIPSIVDIFKKQGLSLPLPTQIVITISDLIIGYWWVAVLICLIVFEVGRRYYISEQGRQKVDALLLKLPVFGPIYIKVLTARISSTLATLVGSGVELLKALEITRNVIGNVLVAGVLDSAREGVREGKSLSKEILRHDILPSMLSRMIAIGEKSGGLENMLEKAAKTFDGDVKSSLDGMTSLLEPLLMVVVGVIVLIIVVSVLLPMTELMDVIAL
ncbi:MAG: type II secretion system inner membrane protein GspF [Bdellovibrionales bacterium]|nr:type II secretion system inner membrane protein GspF [Bdellovibrionales bacterium]